MLRRLVIALVPLACLCAPAAAVAQDREPVAASVKVDDLDLSKPAGRATLRAREAAAADRACGVGGSVGGGGASNGQDTARCRAEVIRDAEMKTAAMTAPQSPAMGSASLRRRAHARMAPIPNPSHHRAHAKRHRHVVHRRTVTTTTVRTTTGA